MSGIFGYTTKNASNQYLQPLSYWNRSYGRENSGEWALGKTAMGCHQEHLSDQFPGSAPVIRRDGKAAVIDAILYNRDELLSLLQYTDTKISDEDLLFDWIGQKGFEALAQVNGDFAGAIYDETEKTWTLFRDHSGVRPMFYYLDNTTLAFSTDLRGLTALPGADLKINEDKFYLRMMGYNDLSLCETEYEKIRCVRPASWTVIREVETGFEFRVHIYWRWRQKKIRMKSDKDYQRELSRLITDAVERRLKAFPGLVGCELSGGLDSSVIAILISRLGRQEECFSWSFSTEDIPLKDRDERKIIQDICEQEHISCSFARINLSGNMEELFEKVDPPYLNTKNITTGSSLLAKKGVRVMFTGHGGDEGVSHRCNFYELWYHHEYYSFFRNIYRGTRGKNLRLLRTVKRSLHQIFKQNPYFRNPYYNRYTNASRFVNTQFAQRLGKTAKPLSLPFAYDPREYILQGGHRVRLDNVALQGAECGVRYMIPFVDYRVLDFALSIPRAQFHNGYNNRYIYREAFNDMIPQSLRDMHYKDTPSQDDYMPDIDLFEHFIMTKSQLLNHLDREYWKDYLNFDEVDAYMLPKTCTRDDYIRASAVLNELTICAVIHHTAKNASVWSENHG